MRIAIVTDYYYPQLGGITEHVHGQAMHLHLRGHEVTVITGHLWRPPKVVDPGYQPERHVPFEVLRIGPALRAYGNASQTLHTFDPLIAHRLKRLFARRRFDVIHTHAPYNPSFVLLVPFVTPSTSITIGTFHSVFAQTRGLDLVAPLMRRSIARLDGKIVVSEACIDSLMPYFPFEYTVIPNGIDDEHFSPEALPLPRFADGVPTILFLGRFDPRNGLGTMIDAFVRVRRERAEQIRLVVVGDGPLRAFYERRVPADLAADIVWAGRVNWDRPRYFASADILCTPCNKASFGMVLLEAMSCGVPVVASDISGFQLLMEHGRQGLIVSPADDDRAFADGIERLLDNPEERRRMGCEGRITAVNNYSWTNVVGRLEAFYLDVRQRKGLA